MDIMLRLCVFALLFDFAGPTGNSPPQIEGAEAFHIAIVGAGIAGASSAFQLRSLSSSAFNRPVEVIIYESASDVGGQIKTVFPPSSHHALEAGASHFFKDDWCLVDAARSTKLEWRAAPQNIRAWIWNGLEFLEDRFCFGDTQRRTPPFWDPRGFARKRVKDAAAAFLSGMKFEWDHGFVPWKLRRKISALQTRFGLFGKNGTFDNVRDELERLGLGKTFSSSAEEFLDYLGVPRPLQLSRLEPCIVNLFGARLKQAIGLHAVVSLASTRSEPIAIESGNTDLVRRMIKQSRAELRLNSEVVQIETGGFRRFALTIASSEVTVPKRAEYDAVIFTGGSMSRLKPHPRRRSTESQIHITHFSTSDGLDPNAFSRNLGSVPLSILTNKNSSYLGEEARVSSLTTIPESYIDRTGCAGGDTCDQFVDVHRVDSRQHLSQKTLRRMIGDMEIPDSGSILWTNSQVWNRRRFVGDLGPGKIELEPNLFDVNNDFIDTMETSCRMGRNVALRVLEQNLLPNGLSYESVSLSEFDDREEPRQVEAV